MKKRKKKFLWENKNKDVRGGKKERDGEFRWKEVERERERKEGEENEEDGEVRIR